MLTRTHIELLLDPKNDGEAEETLTVEVRTADQMVGESVAQRNGIIAPLSEAPVSHTVVWAYCAAVREGKFDGDFQEFRARCITFTEHGGEPVDPTMGRSATDSVSPPTSPAPGSGSTQDSTSD